MDHKTSALKEFLLWYDIFLIVNILEFESNMRVLKEQTCDLTS